MDPQRRRHYLQGSPDLGAKWKIDNPSRKMSSTDRADGSYVAKTWDAFSEMVSQAKDACIPEPTEELGDTHLGGF